MFEYHGNIEGLKKELEEYGARIEKAYRDAFGNELIDEFIEKSGNLLTPECFRENTEEGAVLLDEDYSNVSNFETRVFAYPDLQDKPLIKRDGSFACEDNIEIHTTPFFLLPEECFTQKRPKLPKYLQSFLHEYNHFIQYVIQEFPVEVMIGVPILSLQKLGYKGNTMVQLSLEAKDKHPAPAGLIAYFVKLSEAMAAKMDIDVWKGLGYKRNDVVMDFGNEMLSGTRIELLSGDYFRPLLRNWENFDFSINPFVRRFIRTFKGKLRIYKHPFGEFERLQKKLT